MRKQHVPQTVLIGAKRRVNPDTLMAAFDSRGNALWDLPAPVRYAEHKRKGEPVQVPVYRGASASYIRYVKSQINRDKRKQREAQAEVDALNAAENKSLQEAETAMQDLLLNPGGHDVSEDEAG